MFEGPQSGKFGVIHNLDLAITHMFNWSLDNVSHTPETYFASNTKFAPNRNPGVVDWGGNFSLYDGAYIIFPGEFLYCLEMFTAPTSGVYGNVGNTWCGQAIVESVTLNWAWGAEQSLTQQVVIAANGDIAQRNRVIDDTGTASPNKMCGLAPTWAIDNPPTAWSTIENVQSMALTFTSANQPFVNSSTGCATHRRPGNLDWTLAITFTDHRVVTFTREQVRSFRLYNSTTTYWELVYSIYAGMSNIVADRESGAIQAATANWSMKAFGAATLGHIANPATVNVWPPVASATSVPDAPTSPAAADAGGQDMNVTWTAPAGGVTPVGYTVWASVDGIDFACVGCNTDTSYTDVGLQPNAVGYYYKIAAYAANGQGPFSTVSTVTPLA